MSSGNSSYKPLGPGMSPDSLPFEVFEMIVGNISFVDLPRFLQTSKAINYAFAGTRYSSQLASIAEADLKILHSLLSRFKKEAHHWTTHNILETYTDLYCHHCGDFGFHFLWCCVPTLKLCALCINRPQYRFIKLSDGLAMYNYKAKDVATLPKLKSLQNRLFEFNKPIVVRYMLMPPSERNGTAPMGNLDCYFPEKFAETFTHWSMGNSSTTGCVKVSTTFDHTSGHWLEEIICSHCDLTPGEEEWWLNCLPTLHLTPLRLVPRSYEHLHEHISRKHPDLLDYFVKGWKALSPELRDAFENPAPSVADAAPLPYPPPQFPGAMGYSTFPAGLGLPPQLAPFPAAVIQRMALAMQSVQQLPTRTISAPRGRTRRSRTNPSYRILTGPFPPQPITQWPLIWHSWAAFIMTQLSTPLFPFQEGLDFMTEKMEHAGSIFGLPEMPDGYDETFPAPIGAMWNPQYKQTVAERVLLDLLEKVKSEVWPKIKSKIEEEGIGGLMPLLQGKSIFAEDGFDMAEFLNTG